MQRRGRERKRRGGEGGVERKEEGEGKGEERRIVGKGRGKKRQQWKEGCKGKRKKEQKRRDKKSRHSGLQGEWHSLIPTTVRHLERA